MAAMDRRDFLKLAGIAGLGVSMPFVGGRLARASVETYDGRLWILVNAQGGWDPTSLCDPKGRLTEDDESPVNLYFTDDILEAGNLQYAPIDGLAPFFEAYFPQLLIINGVDTSTNGHDSGRRHMWSGRLAEGYPTFGALIAATVGPDLPMGFITNGGYDYTADVVSRVRVGNTGVLTRLAFPNRIDPAVADVRYHSESTYGRIAALRQARLVERMAEAQLPRVHDALGMLYGAHTSENQLKKLTEYLPETLDNSGNGLKKQAQVAIAAYKAGMTCSANLTYGNFDTHSNHDQNQYPRLANLVDGVGFIMEEADRQGVADKVVVVVGSDFGRTPHYNDGNGKDHWSITSYMLMGAGIEGNRVVGATDGGHVPLPVNPTTLELDPDGIRITPGHVMRSLRKLAGIEDEDITGLFPIDAEDLPLLTT